MICVVDFVASVLHGWTRRPNRSGAANGAKSQRRRTQRPKVVLAENNRSLIGEWDRSPDRVSELKGAHRRRQVLMAFIPTRREVDERLLNYLAFEWSNVCRIYRRT